MGNEKTVKVTFNMDEELSKKVDYFASFNGLDRSNALRFLITRSIRTLPGNASELDGDGGWEMYQAIEELKTGMNEKERNMVDATRRLVEKSGFDYEEFLKNPDEVWEKMCENQNAEK
jgi:hypothetical protein